MIEIAFTLAYKNVRAVFFVFSSFALFEPDTVPFDVTLYAKWTKEISPSAKAASLDYVKGTKANTITVSATVSNYVKSSDGYN